MLVIRADERLMVTRKKGGFTNTETERVFCLCDTVKGCVYSSSTGAFFPFFYGCCD